MKTIGCVLYEVELNEIKELPLGWSVLRYDILYERYSVMTAGVDRFRQEGKRYAFFLFKAPPLPTLKDENVNLKGGGVCS